MSSLYFLNFVATQIQALAAVFFVVFFIVSFSFVLIFSTRDCHTHHQASTCFCVCVQFLLGFSLAYVNLFGIKALLLYMVSNCSLLALANVELIYHNVMCICYNYGNSLHLKFRKHLTLLPPAQFSHTVLEVCQQFSTHENSKGATQVHSNPREKRKHNLCCLGYGEPPVPS